MECSKRHANFRTWILIAHAASISGEVLEQNVQIESLTSCPVAKPVLSYRA